MTDRARVIPNAEDKKRSLEMLRQSNQQLEVTAVALDKLIVMVETDLSQQRLGKRSKTTSNSTAI
jgi:glutamate racemase